MRKRNNQAKRAGKVKNFDADSAGMNKQAASATEATGLLYDPARTGFEAEASEEIFPLEAPPPHDEVEPLGDPMPAGERHRLGTVRPSRDDLPLYGILGDTEYGMIGEPGPGYFAELGFIDPANNFVNIEDDKVPVK